MATKRKPASPTSPTSPAPAPRGDRIVVEVDALQPNRWNPNRQAEATKRKLAKSLVRFGVVSEVIVREVGPDLPAGSGNAPVRGLEIIDGEHRWHQLKAAGAVHVEVRNLGCVTDHEAMQLTVIMNELTGAPSPVRLSQLLQELERVGALGAAAEVLPYSDSELTRMMGLLTPDATIDALGADLDAYVASGPREIGTRANTGVRFVLGTYSGWLPDHVADAFDVAWDAIGRKCGGKNPVRRAELLTRVLADARRGTP